MNLLLIVDSPAQAAQLNRVLMPGSRAVAALGATMGARFDSYVLLLSPSAVRSKEQRDTVQLWLKTAVETCIKPENA